MKGEFSVEICTTVCRVDGSQVRRVKSRRFPLRPGKIGNTDEANLSIAPVLYPGPLDQVIVILSLLL